MNFVFRQHEFKGDVDKAKNKGKHKEIFAFSIQLYKIKFPQTMIILSILTYRLIKLVSPPLSLTKNPLLTTTYATLSATDGTATTRAPAVLSTIGTTRKVMINFVLNIILRKGHSNKLYGGV